MKLPPRPFRRPVAWVLSTPWRAVLLEGPWQAGGPEGVTPGQQRADAVGRVAEAALVGGLDRGTRGDRYQVVVHVDAGTLAAEPAAGTSVLEGRYVPAGTSRRVSCDASRVITHDHDEDGPVRAVGRKTRVVSPGLRRALTHRDRACRFPAVQSPTARRIT